MPDLWNERNVNILIRSAKKINGSHAGKLGISGELQESRVGRTVLQ